MNKKQKLDLKTILYLFIKKAKIVTHVKVEEQTKKFRMYVHCTAENEVFVFDNYEEYVNYFKMYLNHVDEETIDLAIYTRGKNGQIVAFKGLCERIIIKTKLKEFYGSFTEERIEEIHSKGKLTPLEMVQKLEANHACLEASKGIMRKDRCSFFYNNCCECLLEEASHNSVYDN